MRVSFPKATKLSRVSFDKATKLMRVSFHKATKNTSAARWAERSPLRTA